MRKDQVESKRCCLDTGLQDSERCCRSSPLSACIQAFSSQMAITARVLFPSDRNRSGHQTTFKTVGTKLCGAQHSTTSGSTTFVPRMPPG